MFQDRHNSTRQPQRAIVPTVADVTQYDRTLRSEVSQATSRLSGPSGYPSLYQLENDSFLRQQAIYLAEQGNYDEAIVLLNIVIGRNPDSASDYNNRGLLYFQNGQFEQALTDYDKALQANSRLAKVYNNRANCYAALGQLAEALADYETAIDLNPANLRAWINQGITYRDLEMYSQAIENFEIALQFSQLLGDSHGRDAERSLEGHIYAERGRTHHLAGDWNCAVSDYRHAISKLFPVQTTPSGAAYRLYIQVETWLSELLSPLAGLY